MVYRLLGSVTLAPQVSTYLRLLLVYLLSTHRSTAKYLHELLLGDTTELSKSIGRINRSPTRERILGEEVLEATPRSLSLYKSAHSLAAIEDNKGPFVIVSSLVDHLRWSIGFRVRLMAGSGPTSVLSTWRQCVRQWGEGSGTAPREGDVSVPIRIAPRSATAACSRVSGRSAVPREVSRHPRLSFPLLRLRSRSLWRE